MSRTRNSIRNIKYNIVGHIISVIFSFLARTVFIYYLNAEYLGLNGLFSNILSILSLAELGIGSAIVFSLYEPLAKNNVEKLNAIMELYKKAYYTIGVIIGILGIILTPFLDFLIKDIPNVSNLKLIYILFVINSSLSYFFSYKRALIIADQKKYIDSMFHYSSLIITYILQIGAIIWTENYIFYLIIRLSTTFGENLLISYKANKLYPFLKKKQKFKLDYNDKRAIIKNVKAMFFHRVGTVIVMGTDNILISKYVGVVSVAIYSNYLLITNIIQNLVSILFQSITASIGNLGAIENKSKIKVLFDRVDFITYWAYTFSSIALFVLLNSFIEIWIGAEYTYNMGIVFIIVLNFFVQGMRKSVLTFRDALGLFWYDRYKPVAESIINLLASIILAKMYGVIGVLIGTFISTLLTSFWVEPYILFKYGMNNSALAYFKKYFTRIIISLIIGALTVYIANIFNFGEIYTFLYKMLITVLVPNIILAILYYKTAEFKFLINIVQSFLLRRMRGDHNQ